MPIYEYRADGDSCAFCAKGFDRLEKLSDPPLSACPECGRPCHRVISASTVVMGGGHHLRESHFSERGFTQYKRVEKGKYEKTAGPGPDMISGD